MLLLFTIAVILPTFLISINSLIFKKELSKREKYSPFECGFDPKSSARLPFSIRFYLISIIFLVFDIEIALILPIPYIFSVLNLFSWLNLLIIFTLILLIGLMYEWNQGALNWAK